MLLGHAPHAYPCRTSDMPTSSRHGKAPVRTGAQGHDVPQANESPPKRYA